MADPRTTLPVSKDAALRAALSRAIRSVGLTDRNRFGAVDRRMMPDRLRLPEPIALLMSAGPAAR